MSTRIDIARELRDEAFRLAYQGRLVIAIPYGKKADPDWRRGEGAGSATCDPIEIDRRWTPGPNNIGVLCGSASGIAVLDVDGPEQAQLLAELEEEHGPLPATMTVRTGREGGLHYHFTIPPEVVVRTTELKGKLQLRGENNYVLWHGSLHPGGRHYERVDDTPMAELPMWMVALATAKHEREVDAPPIVDSTVAELIEGLPKGLHGLLDEDIDGDRSAQHFRFVGACVHYGLTDAEILGIVWQHKPSRDKYDAHLEAETRRSLSKFDREESAVRTIPNYDTGGEHDTRPDDPPPTANGRQTSGARDSRELTRLRAALIEGDAIKNLPPPSPLINDVLDLDSLAVLYGPSGSFKSFVAQSMQLCVATGTWWYGHEIAKGRVLAIVGEGASGIGVRLDAWEKHQRVYTAGDITWLPLAPNLLNRETRAAVVALAAELQPTFVTIDTLARVVPGGNENTSEVMGVVVDTGDQIRQATGACVMYVHHTGRDTSHARGHTALLGGIDTELSCERTDSVVALRATKQRNHPDGHTIARLTLLEVGDSCVLAPWTGDNELGDELPGNYALVLGALADIEVPSGVPTNIWKSAAEGAGVEDRTFYRARARLLEAVLVVNVGNDARPRYRTNASFAAGPDPDLDV